MTQRPVDSCRVVYAIDLVTSVSGWAVSVPNVIMYQIEIDGQYDIPKRAGRTFVVTPDICDENNDHLIKLIEDVNSDLLQEVKEPRDSVNPLANAGILWYDKIIQQISLGKNHRENLFDVGKRLTALIDRKIQTDACAISDHQHKHTTEETVTRNPGGRPSTGILSVANDWKGIIVTGTSQGERVAVAACAKRDDYARLLSAPMIKMLLSIMWIKVTSVSLKISVRKIIEKHHVSKQIKLKCQLCVDKNRATFWCNTCRKNICSFCKMYHEKVWTVMNHDVQLLQ